MCCSTSSRMGSNAYLKAAGSPHQSLEALIAWNKANANIAMPFFGQEIFERAQAKGPLTDPAYLKARAQSRRLAGADGLMATLEREKLDAIIAPSMSPAWPTDHVLGDHFVGAGYGMAAVAGTPSITIPVGDSHGLPIGLTFMGRAYTEADLLGFAYALEQVSQGAQSAAVQGDAHVRNRTASSVQSDSGLGFCASSPSCRRPALFKWLRERQPVPFRVEHAKLPQGPTDDSSVGPGHWRPW